MTIELFEPLTKPTAAQLNAIGASQTALDAVYIGAALEVPQIHRYGADDNFALRHLYRWLLYDSTGILTPPGGVADPVTLSDPESGYGLFDLRTLDWLTVGMVYSVSGCEFAYEREEPPSA